MSLDWWLEAVGVATLVATHMYLSFLVGRNWEAIKAKVEEIMDEDNIPL